MIFVLDIWISVMIIFFSTQITERQGTAMYYTSPNLIEKKIWRLYRLTWPVAGGRERLCGHVTGPQVTPCNTPPWAQAQLEQVKSPPTAREFEDQHHLTGTGYLVQTASGVAWRDLDLHPVTHLSEQKRSWNKRSPTPAVVGGCCLVN